MYDESRQYDNKWQNALEYQVEKMQRETTERVEKQTTARVTALVEKETTARVTDHVKREMVERLLQESGFSVEKIAKLSSLSVAVVKKIRDAMSMSMA